MCVPSRSTVHSPLTFQLRCTYIEHHEPSEPQAASFYTCRTPRNLRASSSFVLHMSNTTHPPSLKQLRFTHVEHHAPSEPQAASLYTCRTPRTLRASSEKLSRNPKRNLKSLGERSFSFLAPSVLNSLPSILRNLTSLSGFKSQLKTSLFRQAFFRNVGRPFL